MLKRIGCVLLLVACLRLPAAGPSIGREGITFRFRPPDAGITLINTEYSRKTKTIASEGETETSFTESLEKTKTRVARMANGYAITSIMLSSRQITDGEEEDSDPLTRASMKVPVTMEVDGKGRLVALRGIDELLKQSLELCDADEREVYERIMTKKRMEFLAQSEWESSNGVLLGITRQPGDAWQAKVKWFLFSPSLVPVTTDYSFIRIYDIAGHRCAMLKNVIRPDLVEAARDLEKMFKELEIVPEGMEAMFSVQSYQEEHTQYIDPQTFISWKELETIEKKYTVTVEGRDIVTTEKSESTITTEVANEGRDI